MATIVSTILLLSFVLLSLFSSSKSDVLGFSADLIHRDSPASPFYDPSLTRFDRVRNALRRSHDRVNHFISAYKNVHSISSELMPSDGEYIMKVALGTPPLTMFLIVDTGSDITWTQCTPCTLCYKQKGPLFDPKKSSTYKPYPYNSTLCQSLDMRYRAPNETCGYYVGYVDGSHTNGTLASETLTLGSNNSRPVYFSGITFGCGFDNGDHFSEEQSGLVGLGGGPNSIVSQIKSPINGKFSYCLTQGFTKDRITSQINFGNNAVVSGTWVASTPIIPKPIETFYYLNLEALSVDKHRIELFNSSSDSIVNAGNFIIDSGTTLTYLFDSTYFEFVNLVRKAMGNKTVPDPLGYFDLCYRISDKPSYPKIKAYFTSASVDLKPINTFVATDDDVTCLAFSPSSDFQIYGNLAQIDYLVGYDTVKGTVSFKPSKCGHAFN